MCTQASSVARRDLTARSSLSNEEEAGGQLPLRSGSFPGRTPNHSYQPGEQQRNDPQPVAPIHHDPRGTAPSNKKLTGRRSGDSEAQGTHCHMPTSTSLLSVKLEYRHPPLEAQNLAGCVKKERRQLDVMHPSPAVGDPDFLSFWSPPKRRRVLVHQLADGQSKGSIRGKYSESVLDQAEAADLTPEACEDSDLTAEQHMGDLEGSKSSREDIDSSEFDVPATLGSTAQAARQWPSDKIDLQAESNLQGLEFQLSAGRWGGQASEGTVEEPVHETQFFSQLPSPTRNRMDSTGASVEPITRADSSSAHWLELSLRSGSTSSGPSKEDHPARQIETIFSRSGGTSHGPSEGQGGSQRSSGEPWNARASQVWWNPESSATTQAPPSAAVTPAQAEPSRHSWVPSVNSTGNKSVSFLPELGRDDQTRDQNVNIPKGIGGGGGGGLGLQTVHPGRDQTPCVPSSAHFVSTSAAQGPNFQQLGSRGLDAHLPTISSLNFPMIPDRMRPPYSSSATGLQWNTEPPRRILQPVRSQQTETTSVNAWRGQSTEAEPSFRHEATNRDPQLANLPPWIYRHDPPQEPGSATTVITQRGFQDWKRPGSTDHLLAASSVSQPSVHAVSQSAGAEQAWRKLLQRVGDNVVPAGQNLMPGFPTPSLMQKKTPCGSVDSQDYTEAMKRAIERFQGHQGEPSTHQVQTMDGTRTVPTRRSHDVSNSGQSKNKSATEFFSLSMASGSKCGQAGVDVSSERKKRSLRPPVVSNPGLWFTLEASQSQAGASPLQQIPTAYVRVKDEKMTVSTVKKYLVNKLGLTSENEVEITCQGQPLVPSLLLQQVRDDIWQAPNRTDSARNLSDASLTELQSEGKAWKSADGSVALVKDVVVVLTYYRRHP